MDKPLDRREFLKFLSTLAMASVPSFFELEPSSGSPGQGPNILFLVFDAFSAQHIQFYGYDRKTTPNLARLSEKAIVYHNHYAAGNFTSPATSSLLTGTLPWTHRAFRLFSAPTEEFKQKNLFSLFDDRYRSAYSHNPFANKVIKVLNTGIEDYHNLYELYYQRDDLVNLLFSRDEDIATVSWVKFIKKLEEGFSYSLFSSEIYRRKQEELVAQFKQDFPRGIPHIQKDNYFFLNVAIDWIINRLVQMGDPFLAYYHLFPPHEPYDTYKDFVDVFKDDGYQPIQKPPSILDKPLFEGVVNRNRQWYDELILWVDSEFGRLYKALENSGILDNTWIVLTSDHGEMLERGIVGHTTPVLYDPILHIPLLIFPPGQTERKDIYTRTSAIDVLPTLLEITNKQVPNWIEGEVLPPFSATPRQKAVFAVDSRNTEPLSTINEASIAMFSGNLKATKYFGYEKLGGQGPLVEIYDLEKDPEELNDLSASNPQITGDLVSQIDTKLKEVNAPFE